MRKLSFQQENQVLPELKKVLDYSKAQQTEVVGIFKDTALTRFSNSIIHQNMQEREAHIFVRAIIDKKIGVSTTNSLKNDSLKECVDQALELAKIQKPCKDFVSLPEPQSVQSVNRFVEETAKCPPERRAEIVETVTKELSGDGLKAAGALSTGEVKVGVLNSLGVEVEEAESEASLNIVVSGKDSSGFASQLNSDLKKIEERKLVYLAAEKALKSREPISIEPGIYKVVLEPEAVSEMLGMLAVFGLGALSVQEGRSFMCGKFGQKITGENITLWDDALDLRTLGLPFDFEGVPRQEVFLLEKGIAKGVVYDSMTATREGKSSTGHALPPFTSYGPLPANLFLQPGNSSLEEMISSTSEGILITRFHYTNMEDTVRTIFTGMTRDGTFLIKDGKIKRGLKNMRFTQNILEALSNVESVSKEPKLTEGVVGASCMPALKINRFNFTGISQF